MRKLICIILLLCLLLAACGEADPGPGTQGSNDSTVSSTDSTPSGTQSGSSTPVASGYVFSYQDVSIQMNAAAGDIIKSLGEPKGYTEEASCAFDGLDKTYYYGSFYLQTYPLEGIDYVYRLWIVEDSVATPEGLYIGAPQAMVEQLYGSEGYNGTNAYILIKDTCKLTVILTDGAVSSIQYIAILE